MPNHRRQDRELDALYETLPKLECQGFCHDSCGPIEMSVREQARIVERARKPITCGKGASCSMLTEDRRCSVYEIRPMVCRLWGLVRSMACPYGCRPEGGLLSDAEGMRLLTEAMRLGGYQPGDLQLRMAEKVFETLTDEQIAALASQVIGRGRATLDGRMATLQRTPGVRSVIEIQGVPWGGTSMVYPKKGSGFGSTAGSTESENPSNHGEEGC